MIGAPFLRANCCTFTIFLRWMPENRRILVKSYAYTNTASVYLSVARTPVSRNLILVHAIVGTTVHISLSSSTTCSCPAACRSVHGRSFSRFHAVSLSCRCLHRGSHTVNARTWHMLYSFPPLFYCFKGYQCLVTGDVVTFLYQNFFNAAI